MVYTQSATAEIRRGEKRQKKEETTGQKYNGLWYSIGSGGHNNYEKKFSLPHLYFSISHHHVLFIWVHYVMTNRSSHFGILNPQINCASPQLLPLFLMWGLALANFEMVVCHCHKLHCNSLVHASLF